MKIAVKIIPVERLAELTGRLEANGFIDPVSRKALMEEVNRHSDTIRVKDAEATALNTARQESWMEVEALFKAKLAEIDRRTQELKKRLERQLAEAAERRECEKSELRELYHNRKTALDKKLMRIREEIENTPEKSEQRDEAIRRVRETAGDLKYQGSVTAHLNERSEIRYNELVATAKNDHRNQVLDLKTLATEIEHLRPRFYCAIFSAQQESFPEIYQDVRQLLAGITLP